MQVLGRLAPLYGATIRKARQNARITALILIFLFCAIPYFLLWAIFHHGHGRYYWNYAVSFHPAIASLLPEGNWGPIGNPPRFVPEIYNAPWMGDFPLPRLTHATYDSDGHLISPVIVKLHVFSTVSEKARQKRHLIRRLSPLLNVPPEFRHLFEVKFILGHAYRGDWSVDEEMETLLTEEQREHGDLMRLNLEHGENLREGKILDWIHEVGTESSGGRDTWWLFKVDDDTVMNLPALMDTLLTLDPHKPYYVGTSLARWPAYHHHFTGLLTGFNWGLLKTLAAGIDNMSRQEIQVWWDDDVLTGELMTCLPPAPHCRNHTLPGHPPVVLPDYCTPQQPPPWGYLAPPPDPDPRTGLNRYDFYWRLGDPAVWFTKGDVARHGWWLKQPKWYEAEWNARIKGRMWSPPAWLEKYAEVS